MRKILFFSLIIALLLANLVSSIPNLEIEKIDKGSVIISELDNPAVFDFVIDNKGEKENFELYSLVGVSFSPRGFFPISEGKSTIEVRAWPNEEVRKNTGFFNFEYNLRGQDSGILKDTLLIKIVSLEDVLDIETTAFSPQNLNPVFTIKNKENTHLEKVDIKFDSIFFSETKTISLQPYEETNITIEIDKEKIKKIEAGPYIYTTEILLEDQKISSEGIIEYLEDARTTSEKFTQGLIIKTTTLTETNEGNTPQTPTIQLKKDIISRLFTVNSPEPLSIERDGFFVTYSWQETILPDETFSVVSKTNYTFPFIILVLIILIAIFAKIHSQTALTLSKRISLVKTKGGEFALKVTLRAKARKHVDNVQIIDSLPGMTKIYEKFGTPPTKIDKDSRRLFWNLKNLSKSESRVFSYIIYSKVNILGRFELPSAAAVYEFNGKTQQVFSNRVFFASEDN